MEEELPFAVWIVVGEVPLRVLGNVQADEVDLAVADVAEGTLKRRLPVPERLDLGAREHEPRLEAVEEVELVTRTPVVDDQLRPCGHSLH